MSRHKCAECGLVNFADQECCKRCRTPLRVVAETRVEARVSHGGSGTNASGGINAAEGSNDPYAKDPPSIWTFNGIGTSLLGWRHQEDGTATATVWFTFLYLPLFPLARWRLVSPTRDDFEPAFSWHQLLAAILPDKSLTTSYAFVGWLPISGREVLFTYLYAYLWVPFKIFAPLWLLLHFKPALIQTTDQ